ncbi:MAG: hypothetical protein B7Z66_12990 [Chromatiales bacterium 21-64-14]|nr:MAG: hypothetical protein B7Z66_12990 [Chromatiales bacterium 21-64-14]HQU16377.1 hypothetical protein [Gammaproteobacteria bacterium]
MSISAVGPAVLGIQRGLTDLNRNAQAIADANLRNGTGAPPSVLGPLVNLPQDQLQVAASVQALNAVDTAIGTLLNVQA